MSERILVAGIGNIFLGDDGFGCEVVRCLEGADLPEEARVVDYGIRGLHLTYDLLQGWDLLLMVDALPNRGSPGQIELIEVRPEHLRVAKSVKEIDAHSMAPAAVLSSLEALGGQLPPTILVGAQVGEISDRIGLSAEVNDAIPAAVGAIQDLLEQRRVSRAASLGPGVREEVS